MSMPEFPPILVVMALLVKNLVRSAIGREWMAIRDMDVAASVIGIRPVYAKLTAFAVSSFIVGVAGALWAFTYLGTVEPHGFDLNRSFQVLFIIIIGGMSSILGNFLVAAFIVLLPVALSVLFVPVFFVVVRRMLGDKLDESSKEFMERQRDAEAAHRPDRWARRR